jgi:hypothetical protein
MNQFQFTTGKYELCKLPEEWRLLELIRQHKYQKHLESANPDREDCKRIVENSRKKIINESKKIFNQTVDEKDFKEIFIKVKKFFYNKHSKISGSFFDSLMISFLGPLTFHISKIAYEIWHFDEVYISHPVKEENRKSEIYGCINTKTCGWVAWLLLEDDRSSVNSKTKYVWLTVKDYFNQETAIKELFAKRNRFKEVSFSKAFSRLVTNRQWYHEDLENFFESFREIEIDNYSDFMDFSFRIDAGDYEEE